FDLRIVDRLHEGAGAAEVHRPLPRATGDDGGDGTAIAAERRVRKLRLAGARYELLDHDQGRLQKRRGFVVSRDQRFAIVDAPGPSKPRGESREQLGMRCSSRRTQTGMPCPPRLRTMPSAL